MTKKSNIAAIIILSSLFAVLCINANAEETGQQAENAGETAINIEKYEDDGPEPEESVQIPLAPSPQQEAAPIMLDGMDLNRLIPPPEIKKEDPPPNEVPVPAK